MYVDREEEMDRQLLDHATEGGGGRSSPGSRKGGAADEEDEDDPFDIEAV